MTWYMIAVAGALFAWAFAEAFVWPVVPDVALASTIFLAPDAAWLLVAAAVAGTVVGGVIAMAAHGRGHRWPLPLVSDTMKARVDRWLDRGARGLVYQPLTAVPYKAFVVEGARRQFGFVSWAGWTAVSRGARMLTIAVVTMLASRLVSALFPEGSSEVRLIVLTVGLVLFIVGWRVAWLLWARKATGPQFSARDTAPRTMHP